MKNLIVLVLSILSVPAFGQYREVKMPNKPQQSNYRDYSSENKGFWYSVEAEGGSSIIEHSRNLQYAAVTFTGGYRLSEYLRLGAGFGGKMYVNNSEVRNVNTKYGIPIFANVRGNFISAYDRDGVPFWSVNVGGITQEGFYFSPSVGYSFGGLRNNFQIGLAYTYTRFKDNSEVNRNISYLGLKLGYEF
nr:hypothetical protein [uncultured Lachnoclostridium sp.]